MTAVTLSVLHRLKGLYRGASHVLQPQALIALDHLFSFESGTGSGLTADLAYANTISLAASATTTLDLAGSLADAFGNTLTFAKVKGIFVQCPATNVGSVQIGGNASNAFNGPLGGTTPKLATMPGGVTSLVHPGAGWTVTAGSGDVLKLTNTDAVNAASASVVIWGTSV